MLETTNDVESYSGPVVVTTTQPQQHNMNSVEPASDKTLPTCENFFNGSVCHRSIKSRNSANSYYSYNSRYGIFAAQAFVGLVACNAWFSIASVNGIFCLGSINSILSIGSVNSFLSIGWVRVWTSNC